MIKKLPLLLLVMAALLPASLQAREVVRLTRYADENLTGVSASYVFEVELVSASQTKAVVEVASELETYLRFEKRANGVVSVGMDIPEEVRRRLDRNNGDFWRTNKPKLILYLNRLTHISLSGAVKTTATGSFTGDAVEIKLSGAANLGEIDLSARELTVKVDGAGKAKINARSLGSAGIKVTGAGKLEMTLTGNGSTGVELTGAAHVRLSGSTQSLTVTSSGAAKLDAQTLIAESVEVKASGAANVSVHAVQKLKVQTNAAAKVRYAGNPPQLELSNPNVSRIRAN